jgi:hypothetical protein
MQPEPHRVAARLGFDEATISRLAARGHLRRLALTEPQIRARLYRAYTAYLLAAQEEKEASTLGLTKPTLRNSRSTSTRPATRTPQLSAGSGVRRPRSCQAKTTSTQIGGATCDKPLSL